MKSTTKTAPRSTAAPEAKTKTTAENANTSVVTTAPTPAADENLQAVVTNRQMRHKELAERVAERTGKNKAQVKPIIEATLAVIGDVLAENRGLILPPLGRIKLQRAKELADGRVMVLKLRQKTAAATVTDESDI